MINSGSATGICYPHGLNILIPKRIPNLLQITVCTSGAIMHPEVVLADRLYWR